MKNRLACLLLAMALLLSACNLLPDTGAAPQAVSDASIWAMDTKMDLRLYGDSDGTCMAELTDLLNGLDRALSATDPDSALTALNEGGVSSQPQIVALVSRALEVSALTDGALDITLLPVSRAWGFSTGSYRVVPADELEALRSRVGMDRIACTETGVTLADGTMLDLGALVKGYAADLCRAKLEAAGLPGILSLGGNLQTVGTKPDGTAWMIGVQDPTNEGQFALTLRLSGTRAAVTAGDYQRYFMDGDVRYCHILDPKTLTPVQGSLRSVTVIADEGLYADALSTALFVLGREAGAALWQQRGDFEAVWIEDGVEVWITPGLKDLVAEGSFHTIIQ